MLLMSLVKFVKNGNIVAIRMLVDVSKEWVDCQLKVHPPCKAGTIIFTDKETANYLIRCKRAELVEVTTR